MKHVAPLRKELGFKTVFNILGPLTNPAGARRQVIGVYDKALLKKMAQVVSMLGCERTLLVSSDMDEISLSAPTQVFEVDGNGIREYTVTPEDFGLEKAVLGSIQVDDSAQSAKCIMDVLEGKEGAGRDIVLLNAGAAIYASDVASSIEEGIKLAAQAIDSGEAMKILEQLKGG
jgi:anthranilate phosphoribosyltransferase